jgi:hypothetical protein
MNPVVNVNLSEETLKSCKIFIATPMYGGKCSGQFTSSCIQLQKLFSKFEVECEFHFMMGESLITRGRNNLVDKFLSTDCTHLLFIDSDIEFNPNDVFTLLFFDKDVIASPYAKKYIRWDKIITAIKNNPKITPPELESISGGFVLNVLPDTEKFKSNEPLEVTEVGTGFMMIKRNVFNILAEKYPNLKYKSDDNINYRIMPKYVYSFFDTVIDTKDSITGGGSDRYLSEDYMFCNLWRKSGGKIFVCPWMITKHFGDIGFVSDLGSTSKLTGSI